MKRVHAPELTSRWTPWHTSVVLIKGVRYLGIFNLWRSVSSMVIYCGVLMRTKLKSYLAHSWLQRDPRTKRWSQRRFFTKDGLGANWLHPDIRFTGLPCLDHIYIEMTISSSFLAHHVGVGHSWNIYFNITSRSSLDQPQRWETQ